MKGLGSLMKQAQQMQEKMAETQEEIAKLEVEGQSGGGLVKITMNGKHQARRVQIDPSLFNEDSDMLEDLIAAAINDTVQKLEVEIKGRYSDITGGMNLPGGLQMPF